jgi:NADH:ubiquinone oxidoreductase subunit 5 (subunit L)/multisubunit Na+/H+ antiporter MnhA subunit
MEGASPSSALGYAALSAHAGLVLLSSTMNIWYVPYLWARYALAAVGGLTVLNAGLVSKVRADRKGSLGNAIATTVGVLYMILAAGYVQTALVLALGHATYRMVQILRAHNIILEHHTNQEALGHENVGPKEVPEWLYRISWRLNRLNTDMQLPHILHKLRWNIAKSWELNKPMQWLVTGILLAQAGVPLTPITEWREEMLVKIFQMSDVHQAICGLALVSVVVLVSTGLVWLVNMSVLDPLRFRHEVETPKKHAAKAGKGLNQPLINVDDTLVGS